MALPRFDFLKPLRRTLKYSAPSWGLRYSPFHRLTGLGFEQVHAGINSKKRKNFHLNIDKVVTPGAASCDVSGLILPCLGGRDECDQLEYLSFKVR